MGPSVDKREKNVKRGHGKVAETGGCLSQYHSPLRGLAGCEAACSKE